MDLKDFFDGDTSISPLPPSDTCHECQKESPVWAGLCQGCYDAKCEDLAELEKDFANGTL